MKTKLLTLGWTACLLVSASRLWADFSAQPPKAKDLLGSWVGYQESDIAFFRLTLKEDNKGRCVVLNEGEASCFYNVTWTQNGWDMKLTLAPLTKDSPTIRFTVRSITSMKMGAVIEGVDSEWSRTLTLYKEDDFLSRAKKVERDEKRFWRIK